MLFTGWLYTSEAMTENVLKLLRYLMERHAEGDYELSDDDLDILDELESSGFDPELAERMFSWFTSLNALEKAEKDHTNTNSNAVRVFNPQECEHLVPTVRGFLLFLEQVGILNPVTRERVINRLMAADDVSIGLDHVKMMALFVLYNDDAGKEAFHCMESLLLIQAQGGLH